MVPGYHSVFTAATMGWIFVAAAALADPPLAAPAADEASAVPVDAFTEPKATHLAQPRYPSRRIHDGREGWVRLDFMVAPEGTPYEIAVTDSTGDPLLEEAAVAALRRSSFRPATLRGQPIDARHALTYRFALAPASGGARSAFVARYRQLVQDIGKGDRKAADAALKGLDARNLYESAFYEIGRYDYYRKWGSQKQQLAALQKAVLYAGDPAYLPEALYRSSLKALFSLQLEQQRFGSALDTWKRLQDSGLSDEEAAQLRRAVDEIHTLQGDQRLFTVDGEIGAASSWYYRLLKRHFQVDHVKGDVAELKLRCDRKYVRFEHDPQLTYTVSDRFASCQLEVVGDPGTTFRLVQS